ncbi:restriction endonuclease subunit S [Vibrio cholerae]
MSQLPKGWSEATLDELLDFVIGGDWGKDPDFPDSDFESVLCIRGTEFRHWGKEKGKTSVPRKVKSSSLAKRKLAIDDILIEISGGGPEQPVGRTVLIDQQAISNANGVPLVCTNFTRLVRPSNQVNSAFLNYFLTNFYNSGEITKYQSGSNNLRNLQFKDYVKIGVPLAPLAEQNRIVEKLDEVLAQVDTIKARLDGIPAILKRFRQSVLAAAVSGRLTEEWRGESGYVFNEEIQAEIPSSWKIETIDDIGSVKGGKRLPKGEELVSTDTGFPYIRAGQLKKGTVIQGTDARNAQMYLEPHVQSQISRYVVSEGDAYITIVGASIGDAGIIPASHSGANLTENAAKICDFQDDVLGQFLGLWLRSQLIQRLIKLEIKSGAQGKLALMRIKTLPFPRAAFEEQKEIVRLVDQYFAFADTIEAQVKKAQARVDKLTQSILAKAFRGELVPQDPNDEPADKLLERIALARKEAEVLAKAAKKAAQK